MRVPEAQGGAHRMQATKNTENERAQPPEPENAHRVYQNFVQVFLTARNLQRFIIYACNASTADNSDPITFTVVAMLSSPVNISLSNVGVRAFKNPSIPPLPYYLLDVSQCAFVRDLMALVQQNESMATVSSDTNSSFVLRLQQPSQNMMIDKEAVMHALSETVMHAKPYGTAATKKRVLAVLTQRIGSMVMLQKSSS